MLLYPGMDCPGMGWWPLLWVQVPKVAQADTWPKRFPPAKLELADKLRMHDYS